jgi:transcriptional regulator with XRE-family HTH domain
MYTFLQDSNMKHEKNIRPYKDIGERIKAARMVLNYSQKDFAVKAGLTPPLVSNWEKGLHRPSLDNCIVLRETYGLSIDFIVFGSLDALPYKLAKALESNPLVIASQ